MAILKKFIGANTIGSEKIQLENDSSLYALKQDGSAEVALFKLDASDVFKLQKLPRVDSALAAPADAKDLVTKEYVDSSVSSGVIDLIGQPNGIASLDAAGKVPVSQLPNAIMEYQGMWDASTNTPALANGAGNDDTDIGNVYKVSVAGSVDFGAGAISFLAGDYVILNAAKVWERSHSADIDGDIAALEAEDLTFLKLDGSRPMEAELDMGAFAITNAASFTAVDGTAETFVDGFGVNMSDSAGSAQVVLTTQSIDSTEAFTVITQTGALLFQAADSFIELAALDSVKVTAPKLDMGLKDILDAAQLQVVEVAGGATGLVSGLTPGALVVSDNATGKASEINYEQISVDDGTNSIVMTSTAITGSLNLAMESTGSVTLTSGGIASMVSTGGISLQPGAGQSVFISEALNMTSAKIVSLADGVAASDAATVGQVDSAVAAAVAAIDADIAALEAEDLTFLKLDGTRQMTGNLDMGAQRIVGLSQVPVDPSEAVNKQYVDSEVSILETEDLTFLKLDGSRAMTADLNLDAHDLVNVDQIKSVASTNMSIESGNTLTLSSSGNFIVDSQAGLTVNAAGTGAITSNSALTLTSSIGSLYLAAPGVAQQIVAQAEMSLTSKKIVDLAAGTVSTDAVNKGQMESYADQAEADAISSANSYTDGQLDALAVQQLVHESKTLVAGDITNGYIDVAFDIQGQPWVQVGRVSLVPGDDFTISGARITFAGAVAAAGAEALAAGDKLSIFYMKSVQPYV